MTYTFDPTGKAVQNQIIGETKAVSLAPGRNHLYIIPNNGPYYSQSLKIKYTPTVGQARILVEGIDYFPSFQYLDATRKINALVFAAFSLVDLTLAGTVTYNYQTIGSDYKTDAATILSIETTSQVDPMFTTWDSMVTLPPIPTVTYPWTVVNVDDVQRSVEALNKVGLVAHLRPRFLSEPGDEVFIPTPEEIGLGNVPNFPQATIQDALDGTNNESFMTPATTAVAVEGVLNRQLSEIGYLVPLPYASSLTITLPNTTIKYEDRIYIIKQNSIPYTTSGVWNTDKVHFQLFKVPDYIKWKRTRIDVTGNEPNLNVVGVAFDINANHDSRVIPQLILNDSIYLIFGVDFKISTDKLFVKHPLTIGDKLMLHTKSSLVSVVNDKLIHKIITVTDNAVNFNISDIEVHEDNLRITLNDLIILDPLQSDYVINNGVLTVNYRLATGDVLEIENIDSAPLLGKVMMRNLFLEEPGVP